MLASDCLNVANVSQKENSLRTLMKRQIPQPILIFYQRIVAMRHLFKLLHCCALSLQVDGDQHGKPNGKREIISLVD